MIRPLFVPLTCAFVFLLCAAHFCSAQSSGGGIRTVMIDPGHGGTDPGAVSGNIKEKDIVLKVALLFGEMIEKNLPDVKVHYTRKTDISVDLDKRGAMANNAKADLFISIHANSVANPSPNGTETFVMGKEHDERNMEVTKRENSVIVFEDNYEARYQGYDPNSVESFIIFSLMQYAYLEQSTRLANIIESSYKKELKIPSRGSKQGRLLVLWQTAMPSVLTEIGFLSNANDRKMMTSAEGQKKIATALFNAFSEYKSKVEGNNTMVMLDAAGNRGSAVRTPAEIPAAATAAIPGGATDVGTGNAKPANIIYRIQVCSSSKKLGRNGSVLKPYKDMEVTEREVDGMWKYYVGGCSGYNEALQLQSQVKRTTPDAFMVAFEDGIQITVSEAKEKTN